MKMLVPIVVFMAIYNTCSASYHPDVPTFHVGSNILVKNTPYCPCGDVNSTFNRHCGVSPRVNGINVTDNEAHFGEFPWQVAIIEKYEEEFICSGVLISPRVVLTAAHCVQEIPVSQIKVRLGEWDILSEDKNPFEAYGSVDIPILKKYLNTETRSTNEAYNLAILKLISPINFDEYPQVAPICLPQITPGKTNLSDCMVTGWIESGVQTLEKQIEKYIGNSLPQTMGMWKHPLETLPIDQVESTCEVSDENFLGTKACSPEILSGITGVQEQQDGDDQFYEEAISAEDDSENRIFSRILSKSQVMVLSRSECSKTLKELNYTMPKPNQLCVVPNQGSLPCLGDIGSPVICRLIQEKKQNPKETKKNDEINLKYVVVGIITQSYSCIGNGRSKVSHPLLVTSISKNLDQICYVMTSS